MSEDITKTTPSTITDAVETNEYKLALAKHLEIDVSTVEEDGNEYSAEDGSARWMVLTDEEADEKWEESLDSYIEDCILSELPEAYRFYFDDEKWKRDAKHDGRGHSLAGYDGEENEETINGTTYYIYRTN